MLDDQEITILTSACDTYAIPTPQAVIDATALVTAADELLAAIRAEQPPTLAGLTVNTLAATVDAYLARETHATRATIAENIAREANTLRATAWMGAGSNLSGAFRKPFDEAAATFTAQLALVGGHISADLRAVAAVSPEHRALIDAADDLERLGAVRDILAGMHRADVGHDKVERLGRVLHLPSMRAVARSIPVQTEGHRPYEAEWWAGVASVPGVVIKWHTPTEQQTYSALAKVAD